METMSTYRIAKLNVLLYRYAFGEILFYCVLLIHTYVIMTRLFVI